MNEDLQQPVVPADARGDKGDYGAEESGPFLPRSIGVRYTITYTPKPGLFPIDETDFSVKTEDIYAESEEEPTSGGRNVRSEERSSHTTDL